MLEASLIFKLEVRSICGFQRFSNSGLSLKSVASVEKTFRIYSILSS